MWGRGPSESPSNCEDDQISATPGLSDTVPASPHISRIPQVLSVFLFSFSSISDQLICLVNTRLRLNSADFGHLMLPLFVSVVLFHKNSVPHLSPHPEKTKEPNAITDSPCHKQSRIGGSEAAGTGCPPCDCGHRTHHPAATRPHLAPR